MRAVIVLVIAAFVVLEGLRWIHPPPSPPRPSDTRLSREAPAGLGKTEASDPPAQCTTGCSVGNHPIAPLSAEEYGRLLKSVAERASEKRTRALETLLFHGKEVRNFVSSLGVAPLSPEDARLLRRELSKTHARVWFRLVDGNGVIRAKVDGARFPLGQKEHVHVHSTTNLQPPEISGTVHRTGLHHLWTRI